MNRREFAQSLLMAAISSQLIDVEKLLWVPKTMITVPEMPSKIHLIDNIWFNVKAAGKYVVRRKSSPDPIFVAHLGADDSVRWWMPPGVELACLSRDSIVVDGPDVYSVTVVYTEKETNERMVSHHSSRSSSVVITERLDRMIK